MGHLRAEKRADKNGKVVTRHVRADDGPGARGAEARIPSPRTGGGCKRSAAELAAAAVLAYPQLPESSLAQLHGFDERTLTALLGAAEHPESQQAVAEHLRNRLDDYSPGNRTFRIAGEYSTELRAAGMQLLWVSASLAPMSTIMESYWRGGGSWSMLRDADDAIGNAAKRRSHLTEADLPAVKAHMFAEKANVHEYEDDAESWWEGRDWAIEHIHEIEEWLRPLSASFVPGDEPHRWTEVQDALQTAKSSGQDPKTLADFMVIRGIDSVAEAAEMLRGAAPALLDGAL